MKAYILADFKNEHNFSFQIRRYLKGYLLSIKDEEIDDLNKADYVISYYSDYNRTLLLNLLPTEIKFKVFAFIDENDLNLKSENLVLDSTALSIYKKASEVLVLSNFEKEVLKSNGVDENKIKIVSFPLTEYECKYKESFLSSYQLDENKDIVFSFGSFKDNSDFHLFEELCKNMPDKVFMYFGLNDREKLKKSLQDRLFLSRNIYYFNYLPFELYDSMLLHISSVLLVSKIVSYPTVLLDLLNRNIPIIKNETINMKGILTESNSKTCSSYKDFYLTLEKLKKRK